MLLKVLVIAVIALVSSTMPLKRSLVGASNEQVLLQLGKSLSQGLFDDLDGRIPDETGGKKRRSVVSDQTLDSLEGSRAVMTGWLAPEDLLLHLSVVSDGGARMQGLTVAGSFPDGLHAARSLMNYKRDTLTPILARYSAIDIIKWNRSQVDPAFALAVFPIVDEYMTELNTACGLRYLPDTLQRESDVFSWSPEKAAYPIATGGLEEGQLAHFPLATSTDLMVALSSSFGIINREDDSYFYDIERSCTAAFESRLRFIPELRVAASLKIGTYLTQRSHIVIWWPHSEGIRMEIGQLLQLQRGQKIPIGEVAFRKIQMKDNKVYFYLSIPKSSSRYSRSEIFIFRADRPGKIVRHPIHLLRSCGDIEGGFAICEELRETYAVPLIPGAQFDGSYPETRQSELRFAGGFILDRTFDDVVGSFKDWFAQFHALLPIDDWRHMPCYSPAQQQLLNLWEYMQTDQAHTDQAKTLISQFIGRSPDSYHAILELLDTAFDVEQSAEKMDVMDIVEKVLHSGDLGGLLSS